MGEKILVMGKYSEEVDAFVASLRINGVLAEPHYNYHCLEIEEKVRDLDTIIIFWYFADEAGIAMGEKFKEKVNALYPDKNIFILFVEVLEGRE